MRRVKAENDKDIWLMVYDDKGLLYDQIKISRNNAFKLWCQLDDIIHNDRRKPNGK